jgi:anti-sigma factor RsiW
MTMDCVQAEPLLHAEIDGELDVVNSQSLTEHVATCPRCAALQLRLLALRQRLRSEAPVFTMPPALTARLRDRVEAAPAADPHRTWLAASTWIRIAALVALLLAGSAWYGWRQLQHAELVHDVIAVHVRSLMEDHRLDVVSTDQHTVKPWFAGKVDFSPWVVDMAKEGFPLDGGRLEYLAGQRAASVVFHHGGHIINLLVWKPGAAALHSGSVDGYQFIGWRCRDLEYGAISDLNAAELRHFVDLVQANQSASVH